MTFAQHDASVFRTVAWAHGTAGHARQCAPSSSQNLYYEWEVPFYYASHGYAVIAPDYAGQGTDIPSSFQYEAGFLHAAGVAYSLVAARKMIGHLLSDEWAVLGHSEGGMTAWRVNERLVMEGQEDLLKAGNFLGAVAAAPALRPTELIPKSIELAGEGSLGDVVSLYLLQSLSKAYAEAFKLSDYLTDEAMKLLPLIDQACLITGETAVRNLMTAQIYKNTSWLTSPEFQDDWLTRYNCGGPHALAAPMLVVQGRGDTLTYPENCEADFDRTCAAFPQSNAELFLVPELGHDPAFRAATPYYWPWVEQLFAGTPPAAGCKKTETKSVNDRFKRGLAG